MSDLTFKLLKLVDKGYSLNELARDLNLSNEQVYELFRVLNQMGMRFDRKYYDDGEIVYIPKKDLSNTPPSRTFNIITSPSTQEIKMLAISDLHKESMYESITALYTLFDYCVATGIHIIVIGGDFLDGINIGFSRRKKCTNPFEQMQHGIQHYPFDKSILSFTLLGNHDNDLLTSFGIDFATYLNNFRHDIIPIGYGLGRINIKNDKIYVSHPLSKCDKSKSGLPNNHFLLEGHHHVYKSIIGNKGNFSISLPSLSNLFVTKNEFLPSAVELTITFNNGYFDTVYAEHLLVSQNVSVIDEIQYTFPESRRRDHDGGIKHEENRVKKKVLEKQ